MRCSSPTAAALTPVPLNFAATHGTSTVSPAGVSFGVRMGQACAREEAQRSCCPAPVQVPCPASPLGAGQALQPCSPAAGPPATPHCGEALASLALLGCDSCLPVTSPQDEGSALGHTPGTSCEPQALTLASDGLQSADDSLSTGPVFLLPSPPGKTKAASERVPVRTRWPDTSQGL